MLEGLVPEFEEREAAVYCHYNPMEFLALPVGERARCVAQYRLSRLVAAHIEDVRIRASEAKSRRR